MPHVNRPPDLESRFFAKPTSFVCACPACGQLAYSTVPPRPGRSQQQQLTQRLTRRLAKRKGPYNPYSGRFTCPSCQRVFVVGLVFWKPPRNGGTGLRGLPPDQWPEKDERRQMAEYAGMLAARRAQPGDHANLVIREACTCEQDRDPGCPVHGYEARIAREAEEE